MSTDIELLQLAADSRLTGYMAVASLCVLMYDHIDHMPEETSCGGAGGGWQRHFTLSQFPSHSASFSSFYSFGIATSVWSYLNTSGILTDIRSSQSCMRWLQLQGSSSIVLIATVDFVLMCRVWILYEKPQWMVYFFSFLAVSEVATRIIVDVIALRK
ncbi:hypothetical protein K438DRAFT_2010148 [Mycena galopus ATCC 62051]|nr:hypothetical protein K438DRAFT_2010148 [Mycena galopus ATCC 62051]